jgi:CheY-like chemotaxis protein
MQILLVEDDEVDAEYLLRSLQKQGFQQPILIATNGIEALHLLRYHSQGNQAEPAWLIITDIQMPLMNGLEFLRELRSDTNLRRSIAFVLTGSNLEKDKIAAYEEHVAGYLLKSDLTQNFSSLVNLLNAYQSIIKFP